MVLFVVPFLRTSNPTLSLRSWLSYICQVLCAFEKYGDYLSTFVKTVVLTRAEFPYCIQDKNRMNWSFLRRYPGGRRRWSVRKCLSPPRILFTTSAAGGGLQYRLPIPLFSPPPLTLYILNRTIERGDTVATLCTWTMYSNPVWHKG
jgi:hypothetical protein